MTTPRSTLVALATYNERDNLPRLIDDILAAASDARILVVDDNSPDGTGLWCEQRAAGEPRITVLSRPGKQGLGSATLLALNHAIVEGYERVVTMDADGSHPAKYVPELVAATADADVVIGSRYCPGGRIDGWPWYRRALSYVVNSAARQLLGLPVADCSGAFRCYRTAVLASSDLASLRASGFAYLEEILFLLHREHVRFREVPIVFVDRERGTSKLNVGEAWSAARVILRLFLRRVTGH